MPENKSGPCVHCGQAWGKHSYAGFFCPLPEYYLNGVPSPSAQMIVGPFFDYKHQFTNAETKKFYDDLLTRK
jgi:hypothetical protein